MRMTMMMRENKIKIIKHFFFWVFLAVFLLNDKHDIPTRRDPTSATKLMGLNFSYHFDFYFKYFGSR